MVNAAAKLIEEWFASQVDDGDFIRHSGAVPYSVIGPGGSEDRIVFATKPAIVAAALDRSSVENRLGMVGRYGLPSQGDLHWIRELVRPHEVLFLGDLDPADLMIYAWLRASLHPKQIVHFGVNDAYLARLQASVPESYTILLTPTERESVPILRTAFPDFRELIGPTCAELLERERKLELEAVASAAGNLAAILLPALA